jgi:protein arginine kinase
MTLDQLVKQNAAWLNASGSYSDIIVSSRVRLARNLRDIPFATLTKASDEDRIVDTVLDAARATESLAKAEYYDLSSMDELERQLLVERHLISPTLAMRAGRGGVMVGPEETYSVMINEEDHLRIQALVAGFEPHAAWKTVDAMDTELASHLDIAFDEEFGFLTACPTNTGTGLRASILIHLPGLVLVQTIEQVLRGISQVGLTVRGFYGEGTDVVGGLFQISNQVTLGISEQEILDTIERVVRQIIDYEYDARNTLVRDAKAQIEDKIGRAYGILSNAHVLSGQEFMNLTSAVRLGIGLGLLPSPDLKLLNDLMVRIQPSHIQRVSEAVLDSEGRDFHRAQLVRERFANGSA